MCKICDARFDDSQATLNKMVRKQRQINARRKVKTKIPLYPIQQERTYRRELREMVAYTKFLIDTRLMPKINSLNKDLKAVKNDSVADDLNTIINGIRFSVATRYPANSRQAMALGIAASTVRFTKNQFDAKVLAANNLPIPSAEPWLADWVESFTFVNAQLISTIPERYLDSVQVIVNEGLLQGRLTGEIKDEIAAEYGVSDRRAQVIARDQVSKLNGQLNRERQERAGFSKYVWRTVGDASVRQTHDENDGKVFSWDDPPATGHPGEDYNCRCWSEPIFDEDVEELEAA